MSESGRQKALVWGAPRIGDVVMAIPALKLIRRHAPAMRLTFVTTSYASETIELTGLVDEVRPLRLKGGIWDLPRLRRLRREVRAGQYDRAFLFGKLTRFRRKIGEFEGSVSVDPDSAAHHAVRNAEAVMRGLGLGKVPVPGPQLEIAPDRAARERLRALGVAAEASLLVVHPGCNRIVRKGTAAGEPEKIWPASKYGPLLARLHQRRPQLAVALVGARAERRWVQRNVLPSLPAGVEVVDLVGKTSIREAVQLLRLASVLLCSDSGVMHLGTVVDTPMVALFGPTDEGRTGPFGMGGRAIAVREMPLEQARTDTRCMERIGVARVHEAIEAQLRRWR